MHAVNYALFFHNLNISKKWCILNVTGQIIPRGTNTRLRVVYESMNTLSLQTRIYEHVLPRCSYHLIFESTRIPPNWCNWADLAGESLGMKLTPHLNLIFFSINIIIQDFFCKYLKFEIGFIRSQNLGDKTIIIWKKKKKRRAFSYR